MPRCADGGVCHRRNVQRRQEEAGAQLPPPFSGTRAPESLRISVNPSPGCVSLEQNIPACVVQRGEGIVRQTKRSRLPLAQSRGSACKCLLRACICSVQSHTISFFAWVAVTVEEEEIFNLLRCTSHMEEADAWLTLPPCGARSARPLLSHEQR